MPKCSVSGSYNADEPGYFNEEPVFEEVTIEDESFLPEPVVRSASDFASPSDEIVTEPPVTSRGTASQTTSQPSLFEPVANPMRVTLPKI